VKLEDALEMLDLELSKDEDKDTVQPVEHRSTSPGKCVQHEWSSTSKTAGAVGSALQTAGR